jgi:fatty-acyl-CoA synthase
MLPLNQIRERLQATPDRVRVALKVGRMSGLIWGLRAPGVMEIVRALGGNAQNPAQIYRVHGKNSPEKVALVWRNETLTFGELDARIDRVAAALAARGVRRGSSVVLMMRNRPEYVQIASAAARLGAAAVAVSWRSTPKELVYLVNHCGAQAIAYEADLRGVVDASRAELLKLKPEGYVTVGGEVEGATPFEALLEESPVAVAPAGGTEEDAAVVVYTSGTTGAPKGAVRKFPKDATSAFLKFVGETPMRVEDVHLVTCPLYHSTAFAFFSLSHLLGNTVVIMDEFKPEAFLDAVQRHQASTTAMVPTMLHRVMSLGRRTFERYETRSLRAVFSGGAPLPAPLAIEFMDQFGDILFNFYGATETGLVTLAKPADLRAAPGTIGRAVPGNDVRLLSDEARAREVRTGEVGELFVKNSFLIAGYHKDDSATRDSMKAGYFSVGDLARKDRDGRYFIEGRKRDMVISGGVNVYPAEIEGVLEQHPDVAEVAVVGIPDPEWGERVRAFVVLKEGAKAEEGDLRVWARERLAGPKVPRDFVFLGVLPRNPTGKVLKRELREHGGEGARG